MRRLAADVVLVGVGLFSGLGGLQSIHAQINSFPKAKARAEATNPAPAESGSEKTSPWSWLTKNASAAGQSAEPPKPSAGNAPVGTSAAVAENVPTHVLRQTTCNIPFTVDSAKSSPTELQLHVSQDRGTTWKFYAKAVPTAGHFTFRAISDGEYWFALRSLEKGVVSDARNQKLKPGLKVIFDTHEPELQFTARMTDAGEVSATWKITDSTLNTDTLKIEYQVDPRSPWQTVMLPPSRQDRDGSLVGNYSWIPDKSADSVLVRAEVSDRAGNKTVISRRLLSPQVATTQPADEFRARSQSMVTHPVAHEGQAWPADNALPKTQQKPVAPHGDLPPPKPSANGTEGVGSLFRSKDSPVVGGLVEKDSRPPQTRHPLVAAKQPVSGQGLPEPSASVEEEVMPSVPATQIGQAPAGQLVQPSEPTSEATGGAGAGVSERLGHERPRMTNARQFSLDYEIDPLGPTALAKVELWGTNDGGRTWKHWQDDVDQASPLDLVVDQDGIYGFRIVIKSSNQLSSAPPQPGDPADLWVGVDTSKPTARLTSAIYGEEEHAGQLDIRWQAVDVWFTDRPITLLFSENPQGPWSTIAAGLPNTGQYFWSVDPRIPRHIYLRIEARDEAGNLAEHQINEPISTAGLIPQGRIRGLRANTTPAADDRSAGRGLRETTK